MQQSARWAGLAVSLPVLARATEQVAAAAQSKSSEPWVVVATQLSTLLVLGSALGGLGCVLSLAPSLGGLTFIDAWNAAAPYFLGGAVGCFMLLEGAAAIVIITVGLPDLGPPQFYPVLVLVFIGAFACVCQVLRSRSAARELPGLDEDLLAARCAPPRPSLASIAIQ
mmetsp:Transcript_94469/g.211781  ORF Transcript_94469/g.211781 Transcript_94469/m.211781 type:complete len:168 (+) Transcript_94469:57-560(+)